MWLEFYECGFLMVFVGLVSVNFLLMFDLFDGFEVFGEFK